MNTSVLTFEEQTVQEVRETPREYWPNLLQLIRLFRESITLKPVVASFRQGWQEASTGQTLPISELWEDIDASVPIPSLVEQI